MVFDRYYEVFITPMSLKEKEEKIKEFERILEKLYVLKTKLINNDNNLQDNILFFKSVYWMFSILYKFYSKEFYDFDVDQFYYYIEKGADKYFENYKNITSENIESRHAYVAKYLSQELKLDLDSKLIGIKENRKKVHYEKPPKLDKDKDWYGIERKKQVDTNRENFKVTKIIELIKDGRFIVRPKYQRAEVKSVKKASRIIESMLLGVQLPPIYLSVIEERNGLKKYTVLDGQQRLIDILKFMGEPVTDEKNENIKTYKNKYALCGLKSTLNGKVYDDEIDGLNEFQKRRICNYEIEAITIKEEENKGFDFVDMFLRLNQNPCPINTNSFEMWNSFNIVNCIKKIKEIAKFRLFKQNGRKMKEEELVTILAYMDYEEITVKNLEKFFKIYLYQENKDRQDEHYEIKLSISNKAKITNFLEDMKPDSNEERKFLKSIDTVNELIDKLKILSQGNEEVLLRIFNPYLTKPRIGNKKDFYLTWLILRDLDLHVVNTYKDEILKDLEKIFKLMKHVPEKMDIKEFKNLINEC